MNRTHVIILFLVVLLGLLIATMYFLSRKPSSTTTSITPTLAPSTFVTRDPSKPRPTIDKKTQEHFDDHHDTFLPTNAPIKNIELFQLESVPGTWTAMATSTYQADAEGKKTSPDGNFYAVTENNALVLKNKDDSVIKNIPFEEGVAQSNFVWLNNDTLLLFEKDPGRRKLDYIYTIKRTSGEKTFVFGSFPIVSRLNLSINPQGYNNGNDVTVRDNNGALWQLHMTY